jgi:hypothetical protein
MLLAAYLGGWMSNEWRHRRAPKPLPRVMRIFTNTPMRAYTPRGLNTPDAIERGMKIDELEMRMRFRYPDPIERTMKFDERQMRSPILDHR